MQLNHQSNGRLMMAAAYVTVISIGIALAASPAAAQQKKWFDNAKAKISTTLWAVASAPTLRSVPTAMSGR